MILLTLRSLVISLILVSPVSYTVGANAPPVNSVEAANRNVKFVLVRRGWGSVWMFRIENNSSESLELMSIFPKENPHAKKFIPRFCEYQYYSNHKWNNIEVGYDGVAHRYALNPGE